MDLSSNDQKWVMSSELPEKEVEGEDDEEEEEEEALSLCDLPITGEKQSIKEEAKPIKIGDDFEFGSWVGSVPTEPEMCAADEVFFQGQILPLRHSISSDSGLAMLRADSRSVSRSESMDHCHSGGFTSFSSRSSSIRSHHSSSSSNSNSLIHNRRPRNQFHSHPSPSPQIRLSTSRYRNLNPHSHKSNPWSFFRVGLVRPPGIEMRDLKIRSNNNSKSFGSRNSSSSTNSNPCAVAGDDHTGSKTEKKKKKQKFFEKKGGLFGGCKCSINAIDTVPSRIAIIKSDDSNNNSNQAQPANQSKDESMKKRKQAASRHRTFEWLKELSLAGVPDEEA